MTDAPPAARRTVLKGATAAGAAGLCLTGAGCAARITHAAGPVTLGPADQVPVGGAKLFRDQKLVVARPTREGYRAFSAVCPHQGCVVASLAHGVITCPCHGSRFDAMTGVVEQGPARRPLSPVSVRVEDGKLVAGS